jgi:hypothetical protein
MYGHAAAAHGTAMGGRVRQALTPGVIAIAVASCGGGSDETAASSDPPATDASTSSTTTTTIPAKQTLIGSFTLNDPQVTGTFDDCSGTGGYDDFGPGMNVTVRDQDGSIVGSGSTRSISNDDPDTTILDLESSVELAIKYPTVT